MEIAYFVVGAAVGYLVSRLTYRHACRAIGSRKTNGGASSLPRSQTMPVQSGPVHSTPELTGPRLGESTAHGGDEQDEIPAPRILPFPRPQLRVYRGE